MLLYIRWVLFAFWPRTNILPHQFFPSPFVHRFATFDAIITKNNGSMMLINGTAVVFSNNVLYNINRRNAQERSIAQAFCGPRHTRARVGDHETWHTNITAVRRQTEPNKQTLAIVAYRHYAYTDRHTHGERLHVRAHVTHGNEGWWAYIYIFIYIIVYIL